MHNLHIGPELSLPLDAVTQTFAILAKRGVGKTYLASVMAEEMLKAGQQIVAVDPTGAWWGLRSAFPIVVLGGEHGDLPLEEHAGELIAQAIVQNNFSAVLDLSLFRKGQLIRFMTTFAETLYRINRAAIHLFIDEADSVAPQGRSWGTRGKDENESRMLGAMEDIVRRGRKKGLGCTLITQRPAVLNKNVLTQCECLFTLRMNHPKDIGAIKEWIDVHSDPAECKDVIASLPSLAVGTAWFWSPGWMGVLKKIKVRTRDTFDSSATPKPGERAKAPKTLAALDINALGEQIKAAAAKAKESDPRELQRRIAELQKQLKATPAAIKSETKVKRVEVPVLKDGHLARLEKIVENWRDALETGGATLATVQAALDKLTAPPPPPPSPAPRPTKPREDTAVRFVRTPAPSLREIPQRVEDNGDGAPSPKMLRAFLTALAQYPEGMTKGRLLVLTDYRSSGSTSAAFAYLVRQGFAVQEGERLRITDAGLAELGDFEPLPKGKALRDYMLHNPRIGKMARLFLDVLFSSYPAPIAKGQLLQETGYQSSGSTSAAFAKIVKAGWATLANRELRASDQFFEE